MSPGDPETRCQYLEKLLGELGTLRLSFHFAAKFSSPRFLDASVIRSCEILELPKARFASNLAKLSSISQTAKTAADKRIYLILTLKYSYSILFNLRHDCIS